MNNIPTELLILILIILFLLSAFFSGSETALMSINKYKMRHQAKLNNKGAKAAKKLLERNFAVAEAARVVLRDQLIKANANVQILLRNYEEKKIGLDHEIKQKLKVQEELKTVRAELRSLKKTKGLSEAKSAKNKSEPKNA